MSSKTVILWGREDLLGKAVELILSNCKEWEVIKSFDEQNFDGLFHLVETHHPKAIIINLGDCEECSHLPLYLIHDHPDLKVITINLENNVLEVYDRHRVRVQGISDLLAVVGN